VLALLIWQTLHDRPNIPIPGPQDLHDSSFSKCISGFQPAGHKFVDVINDICIILVNKNALSGKLGE